MKIAVYPGSFDPVTLGHIDIIGRASQMFDKLVVAVLENSSKECSFSVGERVQMLEKVTASFENVEISSFSGLLADYVNVLDACVIVKGLRAVSDFEIEFQMALINKKMNANAETVFLTAASEYLYLSSSIVREISRYGGNIADFVPPIVLHEIENRLNPHKKII